MRKTLAGRKPALPPPETLEDGSVLTSVRVGEFEQKLNGWQRAAFDSQRKRRAITGATYDDDTAVLSMTLKSGVVVQVKPAKYLAPRLRRLVLVTAVTAAVWLDASGTLPLTFHGYYGPSDCLDWSIVAGLFVGGMSVWPTRHRHPQKFLRAVTMGAAAFGMAGLFEEELHEHHHHGGDTGPTVR